MNERRLILAGAIAALGGCGGNGSMMGMPDAGLHYAVPSEAAMVDTDDDGMVDAPADLSCLGMRTAPTPGDPVMFNAHIYDFQMGTGSNVANIGVDIFPDNLVTEDCSGTCVSGTSDAMGMLPVTAPANGWFAYRVAAGTGTSPMTPVLTIGYNRQAPSMAGATIDLPSVSSQTIGFIPSLYRRMRVAGTGIVSGSVTDCMGRPIAGGVLRLFREGVELIPGPGMTDFFVGYFNGTVPDVRADWTDEGGIYASANVQPTEAPVRVEIWAVPAEGQEFQRIACEEVRMFADAVTIISVGPLRADYPSGSGCRD